MSSNSVRRPANQVSTSQKNPLLIKPPSASTHSVLNKRSKNATQQMNNDVLIESNWQMLQNETNSRGAAEFTVAPNPANDLSESLKISPMLPTNKRTFIGVGNRPSTKSQVSDYNKFSFCNDKRQLLGIH